ncbi:hypothetical protein RZO55_10820 [Clostridium boliviensis]|uniref:SRPBCC family protein n=1 Tax=Clostridium boliviensis TaxID=318465 RepID=A0ABU4GM28_9CLOT|nr:hypothetical protein [Clostridium boliviensis]MDW2798067.1 hypothetical protein [Clostridium boliviensis]
MAYANASVVLHGELDEIFEFILDGRNNKKWRPGVKSAEYPSEEPIGAGAVFLQEMNGPPARTIKADYKIIECDRYKKISFLILNGPYTPVGSFSFEVNDQGISVDFSMEEAGVVNPEREIHFQKVVNDIHNLQEHFERK